MPLDLRSPVVQPLPLRRWPSETPLLVLVALVSAAVWLALAVSVIGLAYALVIGLVLLFAHTAFIAHVRGSAVRLGPDQFPELYERVCELAVRAGIDPVPEAYLMESGGALNALATRFLRSRMIVLYADLLDACAGNEAARDMVIGHELGHIKAGHLRFVWLLAPGMFMPFIGMAYSRAREFTCDRFGAMLCGDREGALVGLAILAAGKHHGPHVDLSRFAAQRAALNTGWMTLGRWLATHPPLCDRVAALEPALASSAVSYGRGRWRAALLLAGVLVLPAAGMGAAVAVLVPNLIAALEQAGAPATSEIDTAADETEAAVAPVVDVEAARSQVHADFDSLEQVARHFYERTGMLPTDDDALYGFWAIVHPGEPAPLDPFDGLHYGYYTEDGTAVLWSSGPDGEAETADDLTVAITP